ncbi:hypothetical protein A7U60_g8743 [Sanghuangporus baumii]|uniref:Transmembrane protein n=1 Tax=Sanghuangporus baumii TaxID=108892 RepID=A0A9Q5HQD9_SANBA|nr:hypothetical protein A7U60_g8743 [Sanghuangporus baumii]
MANPSSSHQDRERERERVIRERSHHHHRTISSTTLLLILSLVLAVLAVMLSLPATRGGAGSSTLDALRGGGDPTTNGAGIWGSFFNPRRSEALVSREHAVAKRESEVAQREAELLAGALVTCSPYATITEVIETMAPVQTIYKEVVHHTENAVAVSPPVPTFVETNTSELTKRIEDLIQRETKVAEREKDMSRREEIVNRREHDAQRRETWIMEQLIALGNDPQVIEEEYVIDQPTGGKRKVKIIPPSSPSSDKTVPRTDKRSAPITPPSTPSFAPPAPASTRPAEFPLPVSFSTPNEHPTIPTTVTEIIYENVPSVPEEDMDEEETVTVRRTVRPLFRPW